MRILITGGAGFVGSNLATYFKSESPQNKVVVLDNLKRRGSEINLPIFKKKKIEFFHGDIRSKDDLEDLEGKFDLMIEASAEPSVLSGLDHSPAYVLNTNLVGTLNCLEFARRRCGALIFLSTSRVYSMEPLRNIPLKEGSTRFEIDDENQVVGVNSKGISENFPTHLPRSFYGATKLASEMIVQEYVYTYGISAIIDRCGVICGPGQFGKPDQGVFSLWMVHHYFDKPLKYTGFGGKGKQVRDLLHPHDLYELLKKQLQSVDKYNGECFNVGGGMEGSVSLHELTKLCQKTFGKEVPVGSDSGTNIMDIPLYITDYSKAEKAFSWRPKQTVQEITDSIKDWIRKEESSLRSIFFKG